MSLCVSGRELIEDVWCDLDRYCKGALQDLPALRAQIDSGFRNRSKDAWTFHGFVSTHV